MTELDERKAAVLRAIVEHYVDAAQPVGSQTVTSTAGLGVSAATVRNEMSVLEREGYITQPHTSAGRVPTDRGYRYYVDHLAGATQLAGPERRRIAEFFTTATRGARRALGPDESPARGGDRARGRRRGAGVASRRRARRESRTAPGARPACRRRALERLGRKRDGQLRRRPFGRRRRSRERCSSPVSSTAAGSPTRHEPAPSATAAPDDIARIVQAARVALRRHLEQHEREPLYVGGASRLAAEHDAFVTTSTARLFELLEQHAVLAGLMRELLGPGLTVRIGAENLRDDLVECSLVLAPYLVQGEIAGTVGVLGPTRMDYRKAQAAVATVSQQLGRQLSQ